MKLLSRPPDKGGVSRRRMGGFRFLKTNLRFTAFDSPLVKGAGA